MDSRIILPIRLSYTGLDADKHVLDAQQLGISVFGTAKLYNSVLHLCFANEIPTRHRKEIVRVYDGPLENNGVAHVFYASFLHYQHQLDLFASLPQDFLQSVISKFVDLVFGVRTGNTNAMEKALDVLDKQNQRYHDFAQQVFAGAMEDKNRLADLAKTLAEQNRRSMKEMADPVGRTCREMTHFSGTSENVTVDEPMARSMKSEEDLIVGELQEFEATIDGVIKSNGTCRLVIEGREGFVKGRITDPSLSNPHNVYTAALDNNDLVIITAKPVIKNGELRELYISDAKKKT